MVNKPERTKGFVLAQQLCYLSSSACCVLNIRWRRRLWSCLLRVYPQLFNQGTSAHRLGCRRRGNGRLDYSASAKWGRTGLILFELQHLSQLYGPISCLKREKGKGEKKGGYGKVMVEGNTSVPSWGHKARGVSNNIFLLLHQVGLPWHSLVTLVIFVYDHLCIIMKD